MSRAPRLPSASTRIRNWVTRNAQSELTANRNGWRRPGMANEGDAGRYLDRSLPKIDPILTPPQCRGFLTMMLAKPNNPKAQTAQGGKSV